jgi:poly(3-hydroxybutyrate) depolymerase
LALALASFVGACSTSSTEPQGAGGSGGNATGGSSGKGGSGGAVGTGGSSTPQPGTGGASSGGQSGTGGRVGSGGRSGTGGSVVEPGTGGAGSGGSQGTGGAGDSGSGGSGIVRDAGRDLPPGAGGSGSGGSTTGGGGSAGGTTGGTGTPGNYPLGNTPVPSAGCGKAPTLTSGTKTIQSNGKSRSYIIRLPDNYDNKKPYKLLFANHWMGGNKEDVDTGRTVTTNVWAYYGLKALDTEKQFIYVAPDGNQCGTWCKDDEKFIDDMYALFKGDLCIDESRVFATGFSYGAIFSYALACDRPNIFRAVAALAAAQNISSCSTGNTPVAYFAEVGMSDTLCSPALGRACRDTLVTRNGCTKASNVPEWKSGAHVCYSYEGCKAGYPVRWCTGNHPHIAAPNDATTGDNGNTTWAKTETWEFFKQF